MNTRHPRSALGWPSLLLALVALLLASALAALAPGSARQGGRAVLRRRAPGSLSRKGRQRGSAAIALAGAALAGAAGLTAAPAAAAPAAAPAAAATCQGQPAPWMNQQLPPGQRARLLVSAMTLAQEVQMTASVSTATQSREVPAIPSLCIPALLLTNGSAGISTGGPVQEPATALPAPISLASTWSPAAASQYGRVEGAEALDQGRNDVEGPDINIARVPVNVRTFEAYWTTAPGTYQVYVGDSSALADLPLNGEFSLGEG
jgi:hypothetical protein